METLGLPAACAAALREITSTTRLVTDFFDDVTAAQAELEPVLVELDELDRLLLLLLEQLQRLDGRESSRSSWDGSSFLLGMDSGGGGQAGNAQLRSSLTWAVRSSADVCTQIRQVLIQTGGQVVQGPREKRERWALTDAPVQVEELRKVLESIRRTVKVVFGALDDV